MVMSGRGGKPVEAYPTQAMLAVTRSPTATSPASIIAARSPRARVAPVLARRSTDEQRDRMLPSRDFDGLDLATWFAITILVGLRFLAPATRGRLARFGTPRRTLTRRTTRTGSLFTAFRPITTVTPGGSFFTISRISTAALGPSGGRLIGIPAARGIAIRRAVSPVSALSPGGSHLFRVAFAVTTAWSRFPAWRFIARGAIISAAAFLAASSI